MTPNDSSAEVELQSAGTLLSLAGARNVHLKSLEKLLSIQIGSRGNTVLLAGEA